MFITIVVCSRDRPAHLKRCLATIQPQIDDRSELLVVGSTPSTDQEQQIALAVGARFMPEPRPGLDVARNRGIRQAKGEIIAFVDDDVRLAEGWLATLRWAFRDGSVACVTGRVLPVALTAAVQQQFEARFSFDRGPEPIRFTGTDARPWFPIHPYHLGTGGNMAFRRKVFDRVGLFDEALDAGTPTGGGGDLDMFRRLLLAGFTAVYQPQLLVYHAHRTTAAAAAQQFHAYGKAFSALMTKVWLEEPALKWQVPRLYRQQLALLLHLLGQRLAGKSVIPLRFILQEGLGNLLGPVAYRQSRRLARQGNLPDRHIATVPPSVAVSPLFSEQQDGAVAWQQREYVAGREHVAEPVAELSRSRPHKLAMAAIDLSHDESDWGLPALEALRVAVVICTRQRPGALRNCLQSLVPLRHQPAQLIVVENSEAAVKTAVIAKQFGAQLEVEPEPGLCRARNRGLAAARTEIVAYLDDDVVVDEKWLTRLMAVYQQNPQVAGVMGLVLPYQLETTDQQLFELALGGLSRGFAPRIFRGRQARKCAPQVGVGANMSFRRQVLQQLGGFDPALDPGTRAQAGGDIDIFYQLLKANHILLYDPTLLVWHTHRREAGAALEKIAAYSRGTAAAYAKWLLQGDLVAGRMLLGYWLRYHPARWWRAVSRNVLLTPELAWAGWLASWTGPWAYRQGWRHVLRKTEGAYLHKPTTVPAGTASLVKWEDSYGC